MKALAAKLGYKPGTPALLCRVPENFREALSAMERADLAAGAPFRLAFARSRGEIAMVAEEVASGYAAGGHLWIGYPKKSGRIASDITRDQSWEPIHALGLLGVSQIALDEDWSALRFRRRDEIKSLTRKGATGR